MTASEGTLKGTGRRALVVVIDACGVGALPDAARYGDEGTNTLAHLARALGGLRLPTLQRLGLGSIVPLLGVPPAADPDHPTSVETVAVRRKVAAYQTVFDTH